MIYPKGICIQYSKQGVLNKRQQGSPQKIDPQKSNCIEAPVKGIKNEILLPQA